MEHGKLHLTPILSSLSPIPSGLYWEQDIKELGVGMPQDGTWWTRCIGWDSHLPLWESRSNHSAPEIEYDHFLNIRKIRISRLSLENSSIASSTFRLVDGKDLRRENVIYSFSKCLLNTYCGPGTLLDAGNTKINKTDICQPLWIKHSKPKE